MPFSPKAIVIYCGLLLTMTAFSVDITLPAFTLIASELQAEYSSVQLVVPVFIFAAGFGQIVMGPLSDRYGRKPVILAGLAVYCLGAVICLFAPAIEILLLGRAIQGIGAAVGPVVGRAVLRDLFAGPVLAGNIALATMIFAFGPIVAPLLGVAIMQAGSWRYVFLVIVIFGLSLLISGFLRLGETNQRPDLTATRPSTLWKNLRTVMTNQQSRFYVLMTGPIMAMMLSILISIPRVFKEMYDIDGTMFALLFALHGVGIIIGQIVNRRMIAKFGTAATMRAGAILIFAISLFMLVLNYTGAMGPLVLSFTLILFATGYLVVLANATALAIDPHGQIAGFVSSLLGFWSQFFGSLLAVLLAVFIGGDLTSFIAVLAVITGFVMLTLFLYAVLQKSALVSLNK